MCSKILFWPKQGNRRNLALTKSKFDQRFYLVKKGQNSLFRIGITWCRFFQNKIAQDRVDRSESVKEAVTKQDIFSILGAL